MKTMRLGSREISDISDIILTMLSFVCYIYRILVVYGQEDIQLPLSGESDFDKYANFALLTEKYSFISSLASMMVYVRVVRILMVQFLDFKSLFYTFHYGKRDLCNIATTMIIIGLGFAVTACILFGPLYRDLWSFLRVFEILFYYCFGDLKIHDVDLKRDTRFLLFHTIFIILFFMVLFNAFVSIVIIKFRYIRSVKQINNEAKARILLRQTKKIINILYYMIL